MPADNSLRRSPALAEEVFQQRGLVGGGAVVRQAATLFTLDEAGGSNAVWSDYLCAAGCASRNSPTGVRSQPQNPS
jgi:hypothetical protein